jgi:hypothetical protein
MRKLFGITKLPNMPPRYNVAPTDAMPVVRQTQEARAAMMRWGHVPYWAKDLSIGAKQTNAWAEEVPRTAREQAERAEDPRMGRQGQDGGRPAEEVRPDLVLGVDRAVRRAGKALAETHAG